MTRLKKRRKKVALLLFIILLIIAIIMYFVMINFSKKANVVDELEKYGYTLDDRDSELMKSEFQELKKCLNSKTIDYELYAELLSKLFVIDLFSIDNKLNRYDVGGSEYIYPKNKDNYVVHVQDTLYKYLSDKKNRKDKYPMVKKVDILDETTDDYKLGEKKYDAYVVNLTWEYEEDLEYDTSARIVLVKDNKKLYIVEYNPGVEQ